MQVKWISCVVGTAMALAAASSFADHTETIVGAAVGGATGALIGKKIGGRNDVVIWGAIGGATGAMVGRSLGEPHERQVVVRERVRYVEDDHYVVVHRPVHVQHVYYEERPRYYKMKHHKKHHHHRDWDDD